MPNPSTCTVEIFIPGPAVAQPRQRHRIARDDLGQPYAQNYTPSASAVTNWKNAVRLLFLATEGPAWGDYAGPVRVRAEFVFRRPARRTWKTKPMIAEPHLATPDADNLAKAVLDALNGYAWADDRVVFSLEVIKRYGDGTEPIGAHITIVYAPRPRNKDAHP